MDSQTQISALLSGLSPSWGSLFNASGLSIRKTDPNNNDKSVADTVAWMGVHARNASSSPQVKQALQDAGANVAGLSEDEIINRIFQYIKRNVTFVEDSEQLARIFRQPEGKELLITPPVLLTMPNPKGDCDCFSMLGCSMLMAKGIHCDFTTIAANGNQPTEFSHVYCMVRTRDERVIPFDASHGKEAGWETSRIYRKQIWPVFNWGINRGANMVIGNGLGRTWARQFQEGLRRRAINGLGDTVCDQDGNCYDTTDPNNVVSVPQLPLDLTTSTPPILPVQQQTTSPSQATGGSPPINYNNILPGIFNAAERVALQTTQQPGVVSCNAQGCTSTVLPSGAAITAGLSSLSAYLPWILIAGAAFLLLDEK
jgi:hypothetical protein